MRGPTFAGKLRIGTAPSALAAFSLPPLCSPESPEGPQAADPRDIRQVSTADAIMEERPYEHSSAKAARSDRRHGNARVSLSRPPQVAVGGGSWRCWHRGGCRLVALVPRGRR